MEMVIRDGKPRKRQSRVRPPEQARVFIRDHHEGYISWSTYERIQTMIKNNGGNFNHDSDAQAVREGNGLLTGLLRCGRCGRKLNIRYWGKSGTAARYLCQGDFDTGGRYCLGFGGATSDKRVAEEIVRAVSPLGIEASLAAIERLSHADDDKRQALQRQWQQLDYQAQRAFEQYNQVDPANRLVAEVLEKRWNEELESVQHVKAELDAKPAPQVIDENQKEIIMDMGKQFDSIWNDPACPMVLKKKIARILINEIMVDLDEQTQQLHFVIHWNGGSHTAFDMPKPMSGAKAHKTSFEDIELIEKMAQRYRDDEIARVLSKLDRRTGKGKRWTKVRVAYVRKKYRITAPDEVDRDPSILTLGQATKQYSVSDTTLMRLINAKLLPATQIAPYAPLEIKREALESEPIISILATLKRTGKLILDRDSLAQQRDLFD